MEAVTRIDLILCHFGSLDFTLEPALSSFKRFFPESRVVLYTDKNVEASVAGVDIVRTVDSPYVSSHHRFGWRAGDLYRAVGLLESDAEIAVYSDLDMVFCSDKVRAIIPLTRAFGFCLPANPRLLVKMDILIGADSDNVLDETGGLGFAWNSAPLFFDTRCERAREYLETYIKIMREAPIRSPVSFYRAAFEAGYSPYVLPFQWCLCEDHVGAGDEIVLHVGHKRVQSYYFSKMPRLFKELKRLSFVIQKMYFPKKKIRAITEYWTFK